MFQYGSMDLNSHNNNQKYIIFFYVYCVCDFRFYVYVVGPISCNRTKITLRLLDSSYVKNPIKVNKRTKTFTRKYQF